ncbi:MAG: hypothetical protein JW991_05200 [Candidatus Pacebacteria bacterium]|nr:hypothetical protein [Candidatus Paceibacterota bacterium]
MRYSKLFGQTKKSSPAGEVTVNANLLIRAGYVNKLMAGCYSYLPLGLRVLRKIENIIRKEMNAIGGQELFLPALHPAENWQKTGAWETVDVLFKIKSRTGRSYALGQSHEEIITPLVKEYLDSYQELPLFVYQIQEKFRDELRAKSGILRGREFGMKDMYSFHLNQGDFENFYEKAKEAYLKVYQQCALKAKVTEASGGAFSQKISYEFMVLTDAGEDDILYCQKCNYCINVEIAEFSQGTKCPKCRRGVLKKARASEVGNVFDLGRKYTRDFDLYVYNKNGEKIYPIMGCYGIGTTRLMGVIVEKFHDERGIIWPESVAPFKVHLLTIGRSKAVWQFSEKVYCALVEKGIEVLFDDRRKTSAGEKFADADLIGIPYRLVVSDKTVNNRQIEIKKRNQTKTSLVLLADCLEKFASPALK